MSGSRAIDAASTTAPQSDISRSTAESFVTADTSRWPLAPMQLGADGQNFLELAEDDDPTLSLTVRKHKLRGNAASTDSETSTSRGRKLARKSQSNSWNGANWTALSQEANKALYLQCYQFILQAQVQAFIDLGLSSQLEANHLLAFC
jgi:hypothetical protein